MKKEQNGITKLVLKYFTLTTLGYVFLSVGVFLGAALIVKIPYFLTLSVQTTVLTCIIGILLIISVILTSEKCFNHSIMSCINYGKQQKTEEKTEL